MGSQPSVVEVPPGHHVLRVQNSSSAPSTSRSRGFQEVQVRHADGSTTSHSRAHQQQQQQQQLGADDGSDIHSVMGSMQRQKTSVSEFEPPKYKEEDDIALETFYHQDSTTYTCLYQGGKRFYLDSWESQDWQPFPETWYKKGVIVTDRLIKNDQQGEASTSAAASAAAAAAARPQDDREGYIDHPTKGRIPTYVFEEKRNVHYFFDQESGCWVRLPISWELHSELVTKLIEPIEDALPTWKDKHDVLAALRCSNYDPHDCIATYLTIGDQDSLAMPRSGEDAKRLKEKEEKIRELNHEVESMKSRLNKGQKKLQDEAAERRASEKQVLQLQEKLSGLEVATATALAHAEAVQRERPRTARPPSARHAKLVDAETNMVTASASSTTVDAYTVKTPEPVGSVVDPQSVWALNNNMKSLHKDYLKLKMEAQQRLEEMRLMSKQLAVGVMKVKMCDSQQGSELDEVKELYRKEALQRKLLYNKLQEMRGNIRVFCRCRYDSRSDCCLQFPSDHEVLPPGGKKMKFDRVFNPRCSQDEIYQEVKPIITSCIDGYNVCILAYGQTGSGKTFTMQGSHDDPGVNVRSIRELLQMCSDKDNISYTLKASMVEIYNETIQDLLSSSVGVLDIRTQGKKIHLPNMTEMFVETLEDIDRIMAEGDKNRHTASTKMNSTSSRSHLVFMITVEGRDKATNAVTTGNLTLCDLAGSERVGKTEAQGQRLVEAAAINKSLSSLGQVFTSLRTGQLHVPYRNSKLTHILQPSLGGDAKACLLVTTSPDEYNLTETISTLQFGSNARQVALGQAKQNKREAPQSSSGWGVQEM